MPNESFRVVSGNAAGTQINLGDEFQIGRAAAAEGRLGDDPELSRAHARVTRNAQGQYVIEDLGSTNGTAVNGQRISGPTVLNPGDTVQVGKTTMQFQGGGLQATALGAAPAGAAPPPPPAPPTAPTQPLAAGPGPQSPPPPPGGAAGSGGPAFGGPGAGGLGGPPGAPPPPTAAGGGGGRKGIFIGIGALAVAAAVVVVLLLVLGGGDGNAEADVRAALEDAAASNDCDALTDGAVEKLYSGDANPRKTCDENAKPADSFKIQDVSVNGSDATADVKIDGNNGSLDLVRQDGKWLIDDFSGEAFASASGTSTTPTDTTPTDTTPTETTPAPSTDPVLEQRKTEAVATLQALIDAVQKNDEKVFCGLLSPRQAQRLVGGPGGDAAIARCVQVAKNVDLSKNVPTSINVTGVRVSGIKASVRLTTGERFTLVRRGGRYVINSGLG